MLRWLTARNPGCSVGVAILHSLAFAGSPPRVDQRERRGRSLRQILGPSNPKLPETSQHLRLLRQRRFVGLCVRRRKRLVWLLAHYSGLGGHARLEVASVQLQAVAAVG